MLIFDAITITDKPQMLITPALYQANLGLTPGKTYVLSMDVEIDEGILEIYQGSQLIYNSVTFSSLSPSASPSVSSSVSPSVSISPSVSPSPSV